MDMVKSINNDGVGKLIECLMDMEYSLVNIESKFPMLNKLLWYKKSVIIVQFVFEVWSANL